MHPEQRAKRGFHAAVTRTAQNGLSGESFEVGPGLASPGWTRKFKWTVLLYILYPQPAQNDHGMSTKILIFILSSPKIHNLNPNQYPGSWTTVMDYWVTEYFLLELKVCILTKRMTSESGVYMLRTPDSYDAKIAKIWLVDRSAGESGWQGWNFQSDFFLFYFMSMHPLDNLACNSAKKIVYELNSSSRPHLPSRPMLVLQHSLFKVGANGWTFMHEF